MDPISEWRTLSDVAVESETSRETIMTAVRHFKVKVRHGRIHEADARTIRMSLLQSNSLGQVGHWNNYA